MHSLQIVILSGVLLPVPVKFIATTLVARADNHHHATQCHIY